MGRGLSIGPHPLHVVVTNTSGVQNFVVTLVGTMTSAVSISDLASSGVMFFL